MTKKDQSLADELHASRNDPDEWDDSPADIKVSPRKTEVISFRLPSAELDLLEGAAAAADVTVSHYIRTAVINQIGGGSLPPALDLMAGKGNFVWRTHMDLWSSQTEAQEIVEVPTYPPDSVNVNPGITQ